VSFKLALVQPMSHAPPDDEKNVADAVRFVEQAAAQGAQFVGFPETYPGPWTMPAEFDPTEALVGAAQRHGVYVQYGTIEPIDDEARTAYNVLMLAGPDGGTPGKYRRNYPPGPWIYAGGPEWDFVYTVGDEFPVFDTAYAKVGLAMCSEVFVPEASRALALRGAELIFLPGGTDKRKLWATWRNLIWARATENLAVVVTTQNLFNPSQRGLAMVATPEEILLESSRAGMFMIDIDLDRVRRLRSDFDGSPDSGDYGAKAGVLSQWLRPEMYGKVFPEVAE